VKLTNVERRITGLRIAAEQGGKAKLPGWPHRHHLLFAT